MNHNYNPNYHQHQGEFNPNRPLPHIPHSTPPSQPNYPHKINSAYHSITPPRDKHSYETFFGKLRSDPTVSTSYNRDSYYTQEQSAQKSRFPIAETIKNPFRTIRQRVLFLLHPKSNEHRNKTPINIPIERFLNRCYNRYQTWSFTRTNFQRKWPTLFIYPAILAAAGYYGWIWIQKPKFKTTLIPNYEYKPEYPDTHVPYRNALLPHTLPTHLKGPDSFFVAEFNPEYQLEQIIRPKEVRQIDRPKFAYGMTSSGTYSQAIKGWGTDLALGGDLRRKPLVDDIPKIVESVDVYTKNQQLEKDDLKKGVKDVLDADGEFASNVVPADWLSYQQKRRRTDGQFVTTPSDKVKEKWVHAEVQPKA